MKDMCFERDLMLSKLYPTFNCANENIHMKKLNHDNFFFWPLWILMDISV